jgi:hypothetical protein
MLQQAFGSKSTCSQFVPWWTFVGVRCEFGPSLEVPRLATGRGPDKGSEVGILEIFEPSRREHLEHSTR